MTNVEVMNAVMKMCEGNPGAMEFIMLVLNWNDQAKAIKILARLITIPSLRGTNLYVLYSDLCSRNLVTVAHLCEHCPVHILEDACSRQDYSGRQLVAPWMPKPAEQAAAKSE